MVGQGACPGGRGAAPSAAEESYEVSVESPEFKFCSAHFTAYPGFRERLHGHNYTVSAQLTGRLNADGYVVDFGDLKRVLREECKALHERVLLPERSDVVTIQQKGKQLCVACDDGSAFAFPVGDCLVLPVAHTTAEEFSAYFWGRVVERLTLARLLERGVDSMKVAVWEGPLQSAAFGRALPRELPPAEGAHAPAAATAPPAAAPAPTPAAGALLPRVVLLTGASRGYGRALAVALAREAASAGRGLHLALSARDEAGLRETADACRAAGAGSIHCAPLDLAAPGKLRESLGALLERLGNEVERLSKAGAPEEPRLKRARVEAGAGEAEFLLVHNAGSLGPLAYCQDLPDGEVQSALDFNVASFSILTSAVLRRFAPPAPAEKHVHVRIVNISSLLAVEAFPSWSLYAMGKAARDMAMRCVAKDAEAQKRDVRTLSWAPGPMRTAMTEDILSSCADPGVREMFQKMDREDSFVPTEASAAKLVRLLAEDAYDSGAHIDYFDV